MTQKRTFVAADYAVFAVMLVISAAIGIYYAIRDRKSKQGTIGYLLAGRSMPLLPVAISLALSFQSSLTMLAIPAEVYMFGTMILWVDLIYVFIAIIAAEIFLPTFYRLGISSTYEYLELRFNKAARIFGTLAFIVATIFYMGIVMYGPALAFGAVTGFQLWIAVITTGLVCTFYTTLGGLRGVIWTDVFQGVIMFGGFLAVLIKGSVMHGGMGNIWRIAERGGRIDFVHFETDVRIRNTVWSILIGGTIRWAGMYAVSQSQVQRYLSCKSEKHAKWSIYLNVIGLVALITMGVLCGLILFAHYETCDPLQRKCVQKHDQLLPYMMLEIFEDYPGVAGLFVSAVYAGSLSSVSSGINAMATVTLEDMIKPVTNLNDSSYTWISKGIVIVFGLLSIGMAFLLSTAKELLQAAFSLMGLMMGPLIGMFTLGVHFPFVNSIGSISGLLAGIGAGTWFYVGSKGIKKSNDLIRKLPLSVETCATTCGGESYINGNDSWVYGMNYTTTMELPSTGSGDGDSYITSTTLPFTNTTLGAAAGFQDDTPFYTLSYHYISAIGLGFTLGVGILVSLLTCGWKDRKEVDPRCLRPPFDHWMFRCCLPEKVRKFLRFGIEWEDNVPENEEDLKMEESKRDSSNGNSEGILSEAYEPDRVPVNDKDDVNSV